MAATQLCTIILILSLTSASLGQLSISADAISESEVYVSWNTLGIHELQDFRLSFTTFEGEPWRLLSFFPGIRGFRVMDLEPGTLYYFRAQGQLGDEKVTAVTHVKTPPYADSGKPANLTSAPVPGGVKMSWSQTEGDGVLGYVLSFVEINNDNVATGPLSVKSVFGTPELVLDQLKKGARYKVQVQYRTRYGVGAKSLPFFIGEKLPVTPKLTKKPRTKKVVVGGTVIMTCGAVASPTPSVTWRRSGRRINTSKKRYSEEQVDGTSTLTIYKVAPEDKGPYVCIVDNKVGKKIKARAVLKVLSSAPKGYPILTAKPESGQFEEGQNITLKCRGSGRGKLRYMWHRDELPLRDNTRYVIDGGSLTMYKVEKGDHGNYVCEVENNVGTLSSEAANIEITERTMTDPPTFKDAELVHRIPFGGAINLTCEADGNPPPSVKWHLENEQTTTTAGLGRFTLALTNMQKSGSFQCIATSGEHTITRNHEVIVEHPALPEPVIHIAKRLDGGAGFVRWRLGDEETNYPGVAGFTVTYVPVDASDRAISAPDHTIDHSPTDRKDLMPYLQGGFRYKVVVRAQGQAGKGPPSEPAYIPAVGQPEIVLSPEPLVIPAGNSAIFHCKASGKPVPLLYWSKGGNRINYEDMRFKMTVKDGHTMLRIDNTNPEDAGTYTCTAANNILRLSVAKEAVLQVLPVKELPEGFPSIVEGPNQMNVSGQQYLECQAEGNPDVNITWYKDSFPVKDSPRVLQEGGRLYFNSLSRTDEGKYQCRASNIMGDVFSSSLTVTKRGPNRPSVKYVRVVPGSDVNLTCVGVGLPTPQVRWMYEGEEIENGGSHILQVMDIRQNRNYTCLALTETGEVPATFVIQVQGKARVAQGKPVIVTDTNRVEVRSGLGLNLTCSTGGIPVLYFKWLVDGELIFQDNRGENFNTSVLYLTNVRHDKNYTCVAVGARENAEVVFQVVVVGGESDPNKPIIITHPQDMYAFKNEPATFQCAAEGDPPPIVSWYKDGKLVPTNSVDPRSTKIMLPGGKLFFLRVIHNRKESDAGVYYCNATNVFGSTISNYATLQIAAVPRITTHPKPVKVRRGGNVTLTCNAIGPPEPMITWRLYNRDLDKAESRLGTNILFLRNVQRSANYTCVAHNSVGRTQEIFQIWVGGKKEDNNNNVKVKEIKVVPGSFLNLTCLSDNPGNTIYSWATEEEDLPVSGPILTLQNVRKAVNYTCTAENPDSMSKAIFMIVLEGVHALVIGGTEYVEAGDTVSITCNATGEYADTTDLDWFKDGQRINANAHAEMKIVKVRLRDHDLLTSRLTIIRSHQRDSGVYVCRGDNNAVRSLDVHVFKAKATPHAKEVRIVKGDYLNLTCVTPDSRSNMFVWKKNNEYIKGHTIPYFSLNEVKESANYTCIAQGLSDVSKAVFKVIVEGRQGVAISGPRSVEIGKSIRVLCNATGRIAAPSDIVWFKDGEVLEESKFTSMALLSGPDRLTLYGELEVRNSTIDDSGIYICQSSLGDSSSFKVKVKEASIDRGQYGTKITTPPRNKNVEDGTPVRFFCSATGPDTVTIHWEKAGRTVTNRGRFSVVGDEKSSVLEIDPVIRGKDDQVACVAHDGVGPTQSHFATINIYDHTSMPFDFPAITEHPRLRAVEKGRTTVFQCEALGTRNATILWFKDKFPLATGGRYIITPEAQRSQLEISGAEKEDEGVYQCSVENQKGITYSKLANLYVRGRQFPPQFTRPAENKRVRAGDDVTLVCTAVGSPMPNVRWYHNGRAVNKVSRAKGRDVIRLNNVQESSDYVCSAENLLGNIEYTSRVIVEDPEAVPIAPGEPVISNVTARQVTVRWEDSNREGISAISVYIVHVRECRSEWHASMSRDVIVGGTSRQVVIPGLKPGTCYQVRLTAKNARGAGPDGDPSDRFFTKKEVSRAAPQNVKARLVMEDSGLVSWGEPPATKDLAALQEYRVLYTITPTVPIQYWNNHSVPHDQTSAIIRALSQYATYTIRIQAVYSDGQRVESEAIELFVKDPARDDIKLTISNLEGEILSPSSVKLFWKNPVSVEPTEGYELYIEDKHDYNEKIRVTGTANSYVLSGLVPGGEYVIRIARRTKYGEGPKTEPISIRLPTFVLEAPSIVDLAPINSSAIVVNWKPPPLERAPHPGGLIHGYVVTVDNQRRRENRRVSVGSNEQSVTIGGLTPDTRYSVRVTALTEQGDGPSSDPMFVNTNSRATQAPIMDEVAAVNETSLFIRWRPSPFASDIDVRGYFVYIEKVKAGPWDPTVRYIMDVRPGTKYDIVMNDLTPGTKFKVEVAWYGEDGEGPRSAPMTGSTEGVMLTTPVPDFLPRAPYLEEVSAMNGTSLIITWWPPDEESPDAEIKGYYVYIERLVAGVWKPESRYQTNIPPEGQLFIIGGLKPHNRYRVTVSAYSENGEGVKSEQLVVDTPGIDENMVPTGPKGSASVSIPQAPSLDEVSAVNATSVMVKWRPARTDTGPNAANIHGYYLYVEIYDEGKWRSEFKFETNALPAGQQLMINGLENNRKYRIRVSGFGPAGEGPQSAPVATETTANAIRGRGTVERTPPSPRGFCQIYLGTVCSRYLRNKSVFVMSRFAQSTTEDKVKAAVTYIGNRLSQKCANLAIQTVCYTAFPPCVAVGNLPTPRAVCREDCYSMDTQCRDEMAIIRTHPHVGDELLPHCSSLRTSMASSGGTCIRVSAGFTPGHGFQPGRGQETRGELPQRLVPSSPQRMAVNPVSRSPYRVKLIWMPPQQPNGDITGYEVGWSTDAGDTYKKLLPANQRSFETEALYRGLRYEFEVRALNPVGMSEPIRAMMDIPEGVPGGPPLNFEANSNSSAIQLSWDPPARSVMNGRIIGYNLKAYLVSSPNAVQNFQAILPGLVLQNVQSRTAYGFQIAAKTRAGAGPWSSKLIVTTT